MTTHNTGDLVRRVTIKNFSHYEVDELGNIYTDQGYRGVTKLKPFYGSGRTRLMVTLYSDERKKVTRQLRHYVVQAFLPNPDPSVFKDVFHKDGDITNNAVTNLQWYRGDRGSILEHRYKENLIKDRTEEFFRYCYQNPYCTPEQIGKKFLITRYKVMDMLKRYGLEEVVVGKYKKIQNAKLVHDVQRMFYLQGMTRKEISWMVEKSESFVCRVLKGSTQKYRRYSLSMEELSKIKKEKELKGWVFPNARI